MFQFKKKGVLEVLTRLMRGYKLGKSLTVQVKKNRRIYVGKLHRLE